RRDSVTHTARPREFDTYQPGSDLMVIDAGFDGLGEFQGTAGEPRSLLDGCPGVAGPGRATIDVRSPDIRFDGTTVTFAMWTGENGDSLGVYTVNVDGSNCQRITPYEAPVSGIRIHNFDPAWSPDGESIVFASTRGDMVPAPTVSRRYGEPQSDIWRIGRDGGNLEQVTFLTNSELSPQMMREGRIIMTTEKASLSPGGSPELFYQLAGRRINWDLTDYHPLLAQRKESPFLSPEDPALLAPSVDYAQATEIREAHNGDFLLILSDPEARGGAGTVAVFNRSVGTFEANRDDPGYLPAMTIPDPAATGRASPDTPDANTDGAYRSPFPLPDGQILVSYAGVSGDLSTATSINWNLVVLNPRTGRRIPIPALGEAGVQ
ncbi:MAG: hypothetical protein AAGC55_32735, partial [Myxococcota bacterium]